MNIFILIIFLNAQGNIVSYTVGGAPSLEQCHKTIEADKPNWPTDVKGLPFCIKTGSPAEPDAPQIKPTGSTVI
jgi:hypothetical protein